MFRELIQEYPIPQFYISGHMALIDVIGRGNAGRLSPEDRTFAFRAHCDFVIVKAGSLTVQRVIEVNGVFDRDPVQGVRDVRKKRLLPYFGIRLKVR